MMIKRLLYKIVLKVRGGQPRTADELRKMGAHIGENFSNNAKIDGGHTYLLTIGNNVILSDCRILLHDASTKIPLGYSKIGRVEIGNNVFIGADAIVLPNVRIGNNCIIGAGTIVNTDVPDNSVAVGNPVRIIGTYEDYVEKNKRLMNTSKKYDTYWKNKTLEEKKAEYEDLKNGGVAFDI